MRKQTERSEKCPNLNLPGSIRTKEAPTERLDDSRHHAQDKSEKTEERSPQH